MSSLYYLAALILSAVVIVNADAAVRSYEIAYQRLTPAEKADTVARSWLETLTLGFYHGGSERNEQVQRVLERAQVSESKSVLAAWALGIVSALFLVATAIAHRKRHVQPEVLIRHLLGVAAIFLAIGFVSPMLSLLAHRSAPLLGEVVLKYQSRGVLSTIVVLIRSGNVPIAMLLLLFSVITPIAKLALALKAAVADSHEQFSGLLRALRLFGNWSMTDVFVVAVILALLVSGTDHATDAWPGVGLYFFAGYSVLALIAAQMLYRLEPAAA